MTTEVDGTGWRDHQRTGWNCPGRYEEFGLSQKDAHSRNKWRRKIKGQLADRG